ncbi:ATP-binding cassette domain-containing protein [Corynebacterium macginleyi]|uniref:Trehalose import ATP-binding protein SugC n=1 Tax=Corynebacterium macginleyi TaxID=38290 RepID=A0A3M0FWH3_9CORY|nr:ABC transporter ATP-binding protein [Corynebacterium macginleyi]MBK4143610.1 ATP-binding cassette domain-containing protein [Corynebacterium macginleyi]MBK4152935.1 ATP-binding cassette domain-containing protein [Corynebacterium macginleyi]MBK4165894.1 ATP-binding cassette domain-containing protein [Corynebacterium macginleyi]MBM0244757.1 ABC transporter ATP-binding protein [Corynebacterium macginleyi]QRJ57316.1 ABC transporter ATP-binding protein [Corynebacterium macginleyi]
MAKIVASHLTVTFPDGTTGLRDINLAIAPGELVALVGPSGSGKTTLLRTIAGFISPSSGELYIDERQMTGIPPEKRGIGMVFQQHAIWPHMSVKDNVGYPLRQAKVAKAEREKRVSEILALVGLPGFENRAPNSLSGGQRQRVALARAVITNPKVLLLDEALSALDEPLRDNLRRELVALTQKHRLTTVHVTHDRAEALAIADRVVVLEGGEIQQIATPQQLLKNPANPVVAAFIADATIVPATISGGRVECPALGISWSLNEVTVRGEGTQAAISPHHAKIVEEDDSDSTVAAIVDSAIFESGHYSVTARHAAGVTFRTTADNKPVIGQSVRIRFSPPLIF